MTDKLLINIEDYYFDIQNKLNKNFCVLVYYSRDTIHQSLSAYKHSLEKFDDTSLKVIVWKGQDLTFLKDELQSFGFDYSEVVEEIDNKLGERKVLEAGTCCLDLSTSEELDIERIENMAKAMFCGNPTVVTKTNLNAVFSNAFTSFGVEIQESGIVDTIEIGRTLMKAYKLYKQQPFKWIGKIDAGLSTIRNLTLDYIKHNF